MSENVFDLTFDFKFSSQTASQPTRSAEMSRGELSVEYSVNENIFPLTFDTVFASQTTEVPDRKNNVQRDTVLVAFIGQLPERNVDVTRQEPNLAFAYAVPNRKAEISRELIGLQSQWQIDGTPVETETAEVKENDTLSLTFRVTQNTLSNILRPLKTDEGKVDVLATDDGGYVSIDRADGNNTFTLTPHIDRYPLREKQDMRVNRYGETLIEQTGDEWGVELELIPAEDRTDTPSMSQTPAADEFGFDTRYGQIATGRVDAELAGTGESGVERYELTARLTFNQAHVFEAALSKVDATRIKKIPDAPNVVRDETTNDDMTITVTSPDQDTISDGDYVVLGWESERLNDAFQQISFVLAG